VVSITFAIIIADTAKLSTVERPGNVNNGRMTGLNKGPNNSNRPYSISNGKNVGVLITSRQYEEGFYSRREATVISTTFSVVSITFCKGN
jgi:nucleoside recognition membrane protein YjiH